jgi:hypothetical protein
MAKKQYQVVSTTAKGMDLNEPFYKSILTFLKAKKASLKLIEVKANFVSDEMDDRIDESLIIKKDYSFSKNILIAFIEGLRAETGSVVNRLAGFCGLEDTIIAGGMNIQLKSLHSYADENDERPLRYVATTGALVLPRYKKTTTGRIAEANHKCGAVVLVKHESGESEFVHIVASKDGSFVYYDGENAKRYHPNGKITVEKNIAAKFGDLHPVSVDKRALAAGLTVVKNAGIKDLFLGDADDFRNTLSHHLHGLNNTRAKLALAGKLSVTSEQKVNEDVIKTIHDAVPGTIYMNASNHQEHRDQAIERGDYVNDPHSYEPLHIQALLKLYGGNAFQASLVAEEAVRQALKQVVVNMEKNDYKSPIAIKLRSDLPRLKFLTRKDKVQINKTIMSKHGDEGTGGAPGSTKTFAKLGQPGVYEHGHFEEWEQGVVRVATFSKLNMDYNEGQPTNWSHSMVLVFEDGICQIVRIRKGKVLN